MFLLGVDTATTGFAAATATGGFSFSTLLFVSAGAGFFSSGLGTGLGVSLGCSTTLVGAGSVGAGLAGN